MSNSPLSLKEIICQINAIYNNKMRRWVNTIIIKKNKNIICVLARKESDHNTNAS